MALTRLVRVGVACLALSAPLSAPLSTPLGAQDPLSELDAFIGRGMREWQIPGLSIAVVKNDTIVFAKGYGVRTIGQEGRVDTRTRFGMMSTTKAMTALALAMLVDEGKVQWDDPVVQHLPWFRFSQPWVTEAMTIRDLLTHRTGLGNTDLLWGRGDLSTRQILERVRFVDLTYSPRAGFIYQNVMYGAAGEVIAAVSGMPWEEFVESRVMSPIGMTRSSATLAHMQEQRDANTSSAHWIFGATTRRIEEQPVDGVPAAGAAWSTAEDAAKWLRFLLDSGRVGGRRLVSEASYRELFKPQVMVPASEFYPSMALTRPRWTTYGLGWFQQDYRGMAVHYHTGSIAGRTALTGLVPSERLAVFVFANRDHEEFRHALLWQVIDLWTNAPRRDWLVDLKKIYDERDARVARAIAARDSSRVANTRPSTALSGYAGRYDHPIYGDVSVSVESGTLRLAMGPLAQNAGPLEHFHYDTFRAQLGDGRNGWTYVTFRLNQRGQVAAIRLGDASGFEFLRRN